MMIEINGIISSKQAVRMTEEFVPKDYKIKSIKRKINRRITWATKKGYNQTMVYIGSTDGRYEKIAETLLLDAGYNIIMAEQFYEDGEWGIEISWESKGGKQ